MDTSKWERAQLGCHPRRYPENIHSLPPSGTFRPKEESKTPWGCLQTLRTAPKALAPLKATFAESQDFTFFRRPQPFKVRRDIVTVFYNTFSTWLFMDRNCFLSFLSLTFFTLWFLSWSNSVEKQVCFYISNGFNLFKPVDILVMLNPTFVFEDVFEACFYNKRFCIHLFFLEVITRIMYRPFKCHILERH